MDTFTRSNLADVAKAAGVSVATVDRVLNNRPGVRQATAERVHEAVRQLDYRPDPAAARLARARSQPWTLHYVLPAGSNTFMRKLASTIEEFQPWLRDQRAAATVDTVEAFSGQALAEHLLRLRGRADAVVVVALDQPQVRHAIDSLVEAGTVVITLVSDAPGSRRHHHVGIDNVSAGRTAASLVGRFLGRPPEQPGPVGIVLGSRALRDHAERLFGFRQVMDSEYPAWPLLEPIEGFDSSDRIRPLVTSMLEAQPRLAALYSIGAGNRGIYDALRSSGRAKDIVWICHELTPQAREALLSGVADAAISQNIGHEVRSSSRLALACLTGDRVIESQERVRIEVSLRDNL
jgi:LacI family transcriptional regulator